MSLTSDNNSLFKSLPPVWADVGIISSPIFPKVCKKVAMAEYLAIFAKNSQVNLSIILGRGGG